MASLNAQKRQVFCFVGRLPAAPCWKRPAAPCWQLCAQVARKARSVRATAFESFSPRLLPGRQAS